LLHATAKFVLSNIKPKCFWGENAPGLCTSLGQEVLEKLQVAQEKPGLGAND
jgi:hypothetical protein